MVQEQANNGNSVLNKSREEFNNKVAGYAMLGRTKKVAWHNRRRYRTI
jgi:hypothetical protein|tara:strand:- start:476 stop:619 length:144 start_codon:yes stop_codon:yes gene_type:complete